MEKKINEIEKNQASGSSEKKITRKQAIKKAGLVAVSTATMMVLASNNAQARRNRHRNAGPRTSPGC